MKDNGKDHENNGKESNVNDFGKQSELFLPNIMSLKNLCSLIFLALHLA